MSHAEVIESAIVNLESTKKSSMLIRVPITTHKILRAYANSLGRPLNVVVASVLNELAFSVQDRFVITFERQEAQKVKLVSEEQFAERAKRFEQFKESRMSNPLTNAADFGLIQLPQTKGNNLNHYKVNPLWNLLVSSVVVPTGPSPNGHSPVLDDPI